MNTRTILFSVSLLCIGFFIGHGPMWGKLKQFRKSVEDAPYTNGFERLSWTIDSIASQNESPSLNPLIVDLKAQTDSVVAYFERIKTSRLEESNFFTIYGMVFIPLFSLLALYTRPKKISTMRPTEPRIHGPVA